VSGRLAFLVILVWAASLWGACGPDAEPGAEGEAAAPPSPISGMYEVSGVTVVSQTGDKREISGKIILAEDGDAYTATYSLMTLYPVGGENLPAEVIGKGEGTIDGRRLEGTAATQLVIAMVPGVDPGFAFVPRTVTKRLVSNSVTTIAADGMAMIKIENQPAEGEQYAPTITTLRGHRTSAAAIGNTTPPAAAP
jgi:hypothetical protein